MTLNSVRGFGALVLAAGSLFLFSSRAQAQNDERTSKVEDRVAGAEERVTTLESSVTKLTQLKISGYVQPQWVWSDIDSLGNQSTTRNFFQIRRGRIKFQHTIGKVSYTLYPDITETGVILKEAFATWTPISELQIAMGSMNRPFGYEIGFSSSSRELAERSIAENRLFNGERDLGLQFTVAPTFGSLKPVIELGLFNGSDVFGKGVIPASQLNFTDSIRASVDTPAIPFKNYGGLGSTFTSKANQKEFIGHVRVPFLLSDEFSFDLGGSWDMAGIAEPTDIIGEYSGTNGALVLSKSGEQVGSSKIASPSESRSGLFFTNRSVFGVDAQFFLSVLPIGGTIIKTELYTGQQPFYGSPTLFTAADTLALGTQPTASTVYKKVMGYYATLVQNLWDDYQLAVRYESWDPNTQVEGMDFTTLRGVSSANNFYGDLKVNTISVAFNAFVEGALRLTANYDHPMYEDYSRKLAGGIVQTVADAHDDKFTFRMQYKF